jgi:hypothetical protein
MMVRVTKHANESIGIEASVLEGRNKCSTIRDNARNHKSRYSSVSAVMVGTAKVKRINKIGFNMPSRLLKVDFCEPANCSEILHFQLRILEHFAPSFWRFWTV